MSYYILETKYIHRGSKKYRKNGNKIKKDDGERMMFPTREEASQYAKDILGYSVENRPTDSTYYLTKPDYELTEDEYAQPEVYIRKKRIFPEGWMPNAKLVEQCNQYKEDVVRRKERENPPSK